MVLICTFQPTSSMNVTKYIYMCASCGKEANILGNHRATPKEIEKADVILAVLHQKNLTIRQFLATILDPDNEDKLKPNSQSALTTFLQGRTITGTQPINTMKLMFHHCLSQDKPNETSMAYHPLPIYAWPPTIPSLHPQSVSSSLDGMDTPAFNTRNIC